jgi:hypothetical protein
MTVQLIHQNHFKRLLFLGGPFVLFMLALLFNAGCSSAKLFEDRPAQEIYNMEVALRAAKEVGADLLAPELFRVANERAQEARREYRLKNFFEAKEKCNQARSFAERAEFEALKNGGKREFVPEDPLAKPSYSEEPISPAPPADPKDKKPNGDSSPAGAPPAP